MLLIDAGSDDCLEQLHFCLNYLAEKKIIRNDSSSNARGIPPERLLVLLSRADQDHSGERTEILRELGPPGVKLFPVSVQTGAGLEELKEKIFELLGVIRIYTKVPGKEPDLKAPFILKRGSTVADLAGAIHRDLPRTMKTARIWGSARFAGQAVMRDYELQDRDIVEIS